MKKIREIELQQIVNNFTNSLNVLEQHFCRIHGLTITQLHKMQHTNTSLLTYVFYIISIIGILLTLIKINFLY